MREGKGEREREVSRNRVFMTNVAAPKYGASGRSFFINIYPQAREGINKPETLGTWIERYKKTQR